MKLEPRWWHGPALALAAAALIVSWVSLFSIRGCGNDSAPSRDWWCAGQVCASGKEACERARDSHPSALPQCKRHARIWCALDSTGTGPCALAQYDCDRIREERFKNGEHLAQCRLTAP